MKKFLFGKKTLSVLCTLALTLSVCMAAIPTAYAETAPASGGIEAWDGETSTAPTKGSGSENDPYIIETAAELYYVVFEAGGGTKNQYYQLANDIYLNDTSNADWESNSPNVWTSKNSSNNDTNFRGYFDGNGYVVHGIYTDITGKGGWYKAALFPRVYVTDTDVEIKNVGVEDSSVNGNYATAAIVGQVPGNNDATDKTVSVSGCYADESVKVNGTNNVGGLVGLVDFKGIFVMENCYSRVRLDYTGSGGKYSTNDCPAEFCAEVRDIFDGANVVWQTGELGKVNEGGGGTVAKYISRLQVDTIDVGVPLLSMHAPMEIAAKINIYMMHKASEAFYNAK